MPDKYQFLSDPWFDEAEKLIREHTTTAPPANLLMNLEVADGDRTIQFFVGSKDGEALFGKGTADGADLTMSTDIETARQVFVANDQQAGMQAFMAGKVRVQGDMTKLMMQGGGGGNAALSAALQEITE
ncbi:MAG TPA: SCP2 sterol-binding domain-containing protein [Acidimicrobiia bacterium]